MKVITGNMYPNWLGKLVLGDLIAPFPKGQRTVIESFLNHYPIHNSGLVSLELVPGTVGMVSVIFQWDIRSLEDEQLGNSPLYLEISFPKTYRLEVGIKNPTGTNIVNKIMSETISEKKKETLLNNSLILPLYKGSIEDYLAQRISCTMIQDIHGNEIKLCHKEEVEILCLNKEGEAIFLPNL